MIRFMLWLFLTVPGARSAILRIIFLKDSRAKFKAALRDTDIEPQTVTCARCGKEVDSEFNPRKVMTAGYYHTPPGSAWADIGGCLATEEFLCDGCMWVTPGFRKIYGGVTS